MKGHFPYDEPLHLIVLWPEPMKRFHWRLLSLVSSRSKRTSFLRLAAVLCPKVLKHIRRLSTDAAGLRFGTAVVKLVVRRPPHPQGVALGYHLCQPVAT